MGRRSSTQQGAARRRAFALTIVGVWTAGIATAALRARGGAATPDGAAPTVTAAVRPSVVPSVVPNGPGRVAGSTAPSEPALDPALDPGLDSQRVRWIGREVAGSLTASDRVLLRAVFGIDDVARVFIPDATPHGVLRYAARTAGCTAPSRRGCRYALVRVGLAAPRAATESWDEFLTRVARGGTRAWPAGAQSYYTDLASLDAEARPAFAQLVAAARRAGFPVRVAETYRSPERQAMLLARPDGRTATATSIHSYGRAADLVIGDGRVDRAATVRTWIAFRRWVVRRADGAFRLVGTPERTWDWPHVELAYPVLGYRSVAALVTAARTCQAKTASLVQAGERCTLRPHVPASGVASRPVHAKSAISHLPGTHRSR